MAIPNTTPTPNELYNGEMKKMKDTELRIVLVVTRATLGWEEDKDTKMRKQEDWISYYQLKQKTGRCYTALARAINTCIKKGWIEARDKKGNLLNIKNKRIGKKIFYRLGRLFLDKIETSPQNREVKKEKQSTSPQSVITQSEAYKRNPIQKNIISKDIGEDTPKSYGNKFINQFLSLIRKEFELERLDGSEQVNRRYAYNLLRRLKKDKISPRDLVAWAKTSNFTVTSTYDLFYKIEKIKKSHQREKVADEEFAEWDLQGKRIK